MRVAQLVIQKLLAAAVLSAGIYIVAQEMGYWANRMPLSVPENRLGAYVVGICLALVGLITLLPALRLRKKTGTISFPGEHGDVLIHLDSVQANLNKVVSKRPEVKRSQVKVIPVADKRRVRLEADVLLNKTPDAGARELAEKLRKFIATTAANMLGIDEISTVDLNVRGIVVDKGTVKAMVSNDEPIVRPAAKPAEKTVAATPEPSSAALVPSVEETVAVAEPEPEPDRAEPAFESSQDAQEYSLPPLERFDDHSTAEPGVQDEIATPALEDLNEEPAPDETLPPPDEDDPRDKSLFP